MGFFDNFGKAVQDTCKSATKASGKLLEEGKIRLMIRENEAQMKEMYLSIGKEYCERYFEGELIDNAKFENEFDEIKRMKLENEEFKEKLLTLKELRKCDVCKKEVSINDVFCQYCGSKLPDVSKEEVKADDVKIEDVEEEVKEKKCLGCDTILQEDAMYCPMCGKKFE